MLLLFALSSSPDALASPPCGPGRFCPPVRDLRAITRRGPPPRPFPRPSEGEQGTSGDDVIDTETTVPADASALSDFPNSDDHENIRALLDFLGQEHDLPAELLYAVAWTESSWNQWDDDGELIVSDSSDYGLMQINRTTWASEYDWDVIEGDVRENAKAGAEILAWAYDYAGDQGYTGTDRYRAAYAVYNGGPSAVHRPWDSSSPYAQHDANFWNNYTARPWE